MSESKEDIAVSKQLQEKSNYIVWLRDFKCAAKAKDILKILKGEEEIIKSEPTTEDNIVY
ncbi:hypothetical protein MMC08_008973, partial [Hypocenomyce scalaris]|nr:hypothetical protein [Hypocenomyce scalaris]